MSGNSEDLYRLTFATRRWRPGSILWVLTFESIPPASGPETDTRQLVVTVTDATYQEFKSRDGIAEREEIMGMEVPYWSHPS